MRCLRILFVDDCEADTLLLLRHIRAAGYQIQSAWVDGPDSLRTALDDSWDLVLSDFAMHDFDGPEALRIVRERRADLPFILVSGAVGEEVAVEVMRSGAHDIVLKTNLSRLVPAIEREVEEASRRARLRASEEALARSERLRIVGQMAAGISHDLNNLLNPLALHVQLAEREVRRESYADAGARLLDARAALARCVEVIERLRSFARSGETGTGRAVDLTALAAEAEELARPRSACRGFVPVRFKRELAPVPPVQGNASEILNAVVNLIVNAIEAMPRGGTICLRCGEANAQVWVEVEDDGPGMSPELQSQVFEPFFTTKGSDGTGLGLAMVNDCVSHHGGRVELVSVLGSGTRIRLTFPTSTTATSRSESAKT